VTRVLIAIVANDAARFSEFWSCVLRLQVPVGSTKDLVIGGDWLGSRNTLVQRCLDEDFDYLWFMDDDHSFGPDMLEKLLDSAVAYELPIVMPLCTTRRAPFHLVTYGRNPDPTNTDPYLPISLEGAPGEGIVELEAGGTAGMLIRRDVLEAIPPPWFKNTSRSEDIVFCEEAKAAGFKTYADLSCRLGHILTAVVTPGLTDDGWVTGVTMGDLQLSIGTAEQLLALQEAELPPAVEFVEDPEEDDRVPPPETAAESSEAERIEIWLDDEFVWWWRAIDDNGAVLRKDSGINEMTVIGAAHLFYPGVSVHQIQREVDDSRNLKQYGVPGRMWNRG
jgi:hypothetical protein